MGLRVPEGYWNASERGYSFSLSSKTGAQNGGLLLGGENITAIHDAAPNPARPVPVMRGAWSAGPDITEALS